MATRVRWLAALAAGLFASAVGAAPVPVPGGGNYEPPTATFCTLPGTQVLADVKAYVKLLGGDDTVTRFDQGLAELFGKATLPALDLTRPVCGYLYLRPVVEQTSGVLVVPIADEKAAIAVLERMRLKAQAEKEPGRYKLVPPDEGFPIPLFAQFTDGGKTLYLSVNAKAEVLDADKRIPVVKLVDAKATTHVTLTVYPDRVPKESREQVSEFVDKVLMPDIERMEKRKPRGMPASFPSFLREWLNLGTRSLKSLYSECESVRIGGHLNVKSANIETETVITPKANTPFATDIAAIKAPVGRFQQLTTKDSVLGGWAMLPTPLPKELRDTGSAFLKEWSEIIAADTEKDFKPLIDEIGGQLSKAVKAGTVDAGFALTGPNKGGLYTGVGAVALDKPADLEKVVRTTVKAFGKEVEDAVKFDAVKVGDLSVHTMAVGRVIPQDLKRTFGEDPKLHVAFAKDAVYLAIGPDAEAELKRASALKPATATAFDLVAHGARGVKLLKADRFNGPIIELGGRIDDFVSYVGVDVAGGKDLRVKVKSGAVLFSYFMFASAKGEFGPGGGAQPIPKK